MRIEEAVRTDTTFSSIFARTDKQKVIWTLEEHLTQLGDAAPMSLDALLNLNTASWNPLQMLTSSLTHGDRVHLIGNLLFFFSFAPAVEILIANGKRYVVSLVLISLFTGIGSVLLAKVTMNNFITLGLSGIVMGLIGMSAFLMPNARIRTFVWIAFYIRICWIPAWLLAIWFIGFDIYDLITEDLDSGINFMAHAVGGISGYFLAKEWFKDRLEEYQEELDDEIEYQKSERYRFGMLSTFASKNIQNRMANEQHMHHARLQYGEYVQKLHQCVTARKDSDAIVLFLDNYDFYRKSPEIYEQLFAEMRLWPKSRALLCLGRLIIDRQIQDKQYSKAISIAKHCLENNENFVLADPNTVLFFAKECIRRNEYQLAYALVRSSETRYYHESVVKALLQLEIEILERYLDRTEEAKSLRSQTALI